MLQDNFFTFTKPQAEGIVLKTMITLNPAHDIFKGHFPGQPIVPGVCMVQMIKEVLENHIAQKTRLIKADNIKFLSFIDPGVNAQIQLELKLTPDNEYFKADAQLLNADTIFLKFKGLFAPVV